MAIAVKVLNLLGHGVCKGFLVESEALRNIKHQNLIKILTICLGVDYQAVAEANFYYALYQQLVYPSHKLLRANAPLLKIEVRR